MNIIFVLNVILSVIFNLQNTVSGKVTYGIQTERIQTSSKSNNIFEQKEKYTTKQPSSTKKSSKDNSANLFYILILIILIVIIIILAIWYGKSRYRKSKQNNPQKKRSVKFAKEKIFIVEKVGFDVENFKDTYVANGSERLYYKKKYQASLHKVYTSSNITKIFNFRSFYLIFFSKNNLFLKLILYQ
jgi:uncharacterized membrane protein